MKIISNYMDQDGLIGHLTKGDPLIEHGDFSDSPQRTGSFYFLASVAKELNLSPSIDIDVPLLKLALMSLEILPGLWIRHPYSNPSFNGDPKNFSRDQQTPLVLAMGRFRDEPYIYNALEQTEKNHRARFWKYQNSDIASPEHMNYYNRAFDRERFYFLGDMLMEMNSKIICESKGKDPDNVGDDLNHSLALIQALTTKPGMNTQRAVNYYVKNRPVNYGCFLIQEEIDDKGDKEAEWIAVTRLQDGSTKPFCHPIIGAWRWYFRHPEDPPMDQVAEPVLKYLIGSVT